MSFRTSIQQKKNRDYAEARKRAEMAWKSKEKREESQYKSQVKLERRVLKKELDAFKKSTNTSFRSPLIIIGIPLLFVFFGLLLIIIAPTYISIPISIVLSLLILLFVNIVHKSYRVDCIWMKCICGPFIPRNAQDSFPNPISNILLALMDNRDFVENQVIDRGTQGMVIEDIAQKMGDRNDYIHSLVRMRLSDDFIQMGKIRYLTLVRLHFSILFDPRDYHVITSPNRTLDSFLWKYGLIHRGNARPLRTSILLLASENKLKLDAGGHDSEHLLYGKFKIENRATFFYTLEAIGEYKSSNKHIPVIYCEPLRKPSLMGPLVKKETPEEIIRSEDFWSNFVKDHLDKVESDLWDFKEIFEMWKITEKQAKEKKKSEFCEHIAAFANALGGLIIVGVTDSFPRKIVGITDMEKKMNEIHDTLHDGLSIQDIVHCTPFSIHDDAGNPVQCLGIAIKQTNEVVEVKYQDEKTKVVKREGSGKHPRPRSQIEKEKKRDVLQDNFNFVHLLTAVREHGH